MAAWEGVLRVSHLSWTRTAPEGEEEKAEEEETEAAEDEEEESEDVVAGQRVSKAWRRRRYLHSVLMLVRCQAGPSQVAPISTARWAGWMSR